MNFSKLSNTYKNFYAPAFAIEVEGQDLLLEKVEVFGVTVNLPLEGAADFSFTVNNPFDHGVGEFRYLKNGLLDVGKNVVIKTGYGDRKGLKPVLTGLITGVDVSFPANGISQLSVKGYNNLHKLMKDQVSKNWGSDNPIKYSDIVREIAGKYRLDTAHVEDTREPHRQIKQDRESDYDFIKKKLAEKLGFEVFVLENSLYFRTPANEKRDVITTLEWGRTLISFSPQINLANQVSAVEVRGWNSTDQQPIIGRAQKGEESGRDRGRRSGGEAAAGSQGETARHFWRPVPNRREATDIAKSILDRLSKEFVTGNGECIGIPDILPGKNIELAGLGHKFSKVYYLEKVTHSVSSSGYKTTFSVKESTI